MFWYVVTLYGCYLGQVSPVNKDFESQWDSTWGSSSLIFPSLYYHCWNSFLCWAQWHPFTSAVLSSPIWEENPFEPARGHNSPLSLSSVNHSYPVTRKCGAGGGEVMCRSLCWFKFLMFLFEHTWGPGKQHLNNVQFKHDVTGAYKICMYQLSTYEVQMSQITKEDLI